VLKSRFARRLAALEARFIPRAEKGLLGLMILHSKGVALSEEELAASLARCREESIDNVESLIFNVVDVKPESSPASPGPPEDDEAKLEAEVRALEQRRRELKAQRRKPS
jgi:hypothetical protein